MQYVQLCYSGTHRNSLPKNMWRILFWFYINKTIYLKASRAHTKCKRDSEKYKFARNTTVAVKEVIPHPMRSRLGLPGRNCCQKSALSKYAKRMKRTHCIGSFLAVSNRSCHPTKGSTQIAKSNINHCEI